VTTATGPLPPSPHVTIDHGDEPSGAASSGPGWSTWRRWVVAVATFNCLGRRGEGDMPGPWRTVTEAKSPDSPRDGRCPKVA